MAIVLLLAAAFTPSQPAYADFAEGVAANDGGDYEVAIKEFTAAAMAGETQAQVALANLYHFGEGVALNRVTAANWYRAAAHQGDAVAQANLGQFYAEGLGVVRNDTAAYAWWMRAGEQGHAWAADMAAALASTTDEYRRAAALHHVNDELSDQASGPAEVLDGGILRIANQAFRLNGIEAPPLGFRCPLRGTERDCGLISASALKDLTAGAIVLCRRLGRFDRDGLPVAHCTVDGYDLSEGMVYTGWAEADAQQIVRYVTLEAEARAKPRGMWRTD